MNVTTASSVSYVINNLAKQRLYPDADKLYNLYADICRQKGVAVHSSVVLSRLVGLCGSGLLKAAVDVLNEQPRSLLTDDMFTVVLRAHVDRGLHVTVNGLWKRMQADGVEHSLATLTVMLDHCANTNNIERAFTLTLGANHLVLDKWYFQNLIRICGEAQRWTVCQHGPELFLHVLALMSKQQFPAVSWTYKQVIETLCVTGNATAAEFYFWELVRKGHKPNEDVLEMLLEAYSNSSQAANRRASEAPASIETPTQPVIFTKVSSKTALTLNLRTLHDLSALAPPMSATVTDIVSKTVAQAETFRDPYAEVQHFSCKGWVAARQAEKTWDLSEVVVPSELAEEILQASANTKTVPAPLKEQVALYHDLLSYGTAPTTDLNAQSEALQKANAKRASLIFAHILDLNLSISSVAVHHLICALCAADDADSALAALDLFPQHSVSPNASIFRPFVDMYRRQGDDNAQLDSVVAMISERFSLELPKEVAV
eukprot:gene21262-27285_t